MSESVKTILVTGISSGIGRGLAQFYSDQGWHVLGLSRRSPEAADHGARFGFVHCDLAQSETVDPQMGQLLEQCGRIDVVVLNAGALGQFGDLIEVDLDDMRHTFQVNVWANKLVLDAIFGRGISVGQVVGISSGASINGNRGWSGYAISKAALNMLIKLYSREQTATHFCALSPGLVDTDMLDQLCKRSADQRYPSLEVVRSKRNTPEMPTPRQIASRLAQVFHQLPDLVESGEYADIRTLDVR